jgi:O-antigen ligase
MDLLWVILFLVMYYIRPQEWLNIFSTIQFARIVMIGAIVSLFFRGRGFQPGQLLRTPHDWMVLLFFGWLCVASGAPFATFKEIYSLPLTYFIIVQTLNTIPRIKIFLGWWTFLIVAIALLAVLSEHGFDPLGSYDLTHGRMKDRLALNLSIFRNPNALGHNVVPAIPMLYYFCIWRRPLFMKEIGYFCLFLPIYCIYLTVSKGSFLTGAATVVATFTFGRPKTVQILIISFTVILGSTALYALPRMNELQKAKTDGAIQGRIAAFKHGLLMLEQKTKGIGYHQWLKSFKATHHYTKAAHSSYVQIAAELGYPGFILFLGILYCNLRTLITANTRDDDEERIRRILFILVISYMLSSWMVDLGYRPTFFMFTAATAAFHRHLLGLSARDEEDEAAPAPHPLPAWRAQLLPQPAMEHAFAKAGASATVLTLESDPEAAIPVARKLGAEEEEEKPRIAGSWNSIGLLDITLILLITYAMVRFWTYVLAHM